MDSAEDQPRTPRKDATHRAIAGVYGSSGSLECILPLAMDAKIQPVYPWNNLKRERGGRDEGFVRECVAYLEWRQGIIRHPKNSDWIKFRRERDANKRAASPILRTVASRDEVLSAHAFMKARSK